MLTFEKSNTTHPPLVSIFLYGLLIVVFYILGDHESLRLRYAIFLCTGHIICSILLTDPRRQSNDTYMLLILGEGD